MHPRSRAGYPRRGCASPPGHPRPHGTAWGGCEHSPCCSHALRRERRGWGHPRAQPCWEQQQSGVGIPTIRRQKGVPRAPPPRRGTNKFWHYCGGGLESSPGASSVQRAPPPPRCPHPQSPPGARDGARDKQGRSPPAGAGRDAPGGPPPPPPARPHSLGTTLGGGLSPLRSRTHPACWQEVLIAYVCPPGGCSRGRCILRYYCISVSYIYR